MSRRTFFEEEKLKKMVYAFSVALVISIIVFVVVFVMYNKKLKEESNNSLLEFGTVNAIVDNSKVYETSISQDKGMNQIENTNIDISTDIENNVEESKDLSRNITNTTPVAAVIEENEKDNTEVVQENPASAEKVELKFIAPVAGDILKDFAIDTLVYSNTLEEWTTHPGIDIKSSRTSIVVASEAGNIESIKNDPRYGLTITISHENGFKTIYSNLLTTEFVSEGETVEQGQTIATIGETASFEIADETHLHFEMYKDGVVVNPTIYLK